MMDFFFQQSFIILQEKMVLNFQGFFVVFFSKIELCYIPGFIATLLISVR